MEVLVTGAAGFVGFHSAMALLNRGYKVVGLDNLNSYYEVSLKQSRLDELANYEQFSFVKCDLVDQIGLQKCWEEFNPSHVLHLAAQAGVRYSIDHPDSYIQSNIIGFQNIIELVRKFRPENFVYASSSSVYGGSSEFPFSESQQVNAPVSLYAATKLSNELVAKAYAHLYKIPTVGLRFFTVYGSHYRPDMAMFKFANQMIRGEKIDVYNQGQMIRDFTCIKDTVSGIVASLERPMIGEVFNFGRGEPIVLMRMIELLEKELGIEARKNFMPMQMGDVPRTLADISKAQSALNYQPKIDLEDGIKLFTDWFKLKYM